MIVETLWSTTCCPEQCTVTGPFHSRAEAETAADEQGCLYLVRTEYDGPDVDDDAMEFIERRHRPCRGPVVVGTFRTDMAAAAAALSRGGGKAQIMNVSEMELKGCKASRGVEC